MNDLIVQSNKWLKRAVHPTFYRTCVVDFIAATKMPGRIQIVLVRSVSMYGRDELDEFATVLIGGSSRV